MDETGRERAARLVRTAMASQGLSPQQVAALADVDSDTVRDFAAGDRWPWARTRKKIEDALGLDPGELERAARDEAEWTPASNDVDPVVAAIERSSLSRANRAKLIGYYYELADGQERGATG